MLHDEGTFDPLEIPLKTWSDYENELWERNSAHSIGSIIQKAQDEQRFKNGSRAGSMYTPSLYGQPVLQHSASFNHSPTPSAFGGSQIGFDPRQSMVPMYAAPPASMGYQTPALSMYGTPSMYGGAASMYGMPAPGYSMPFPNPGGSISGGSQYGGISPQGANGSGRATPVNFDNGPHSRTTSGSTPSDGILEADVRKSESVPDAIHPCDFLC